ncbi:LytR/AlgR family response regulator transcription factor [Paraflavitalea pollutisoli]|uniref:LytR/AlgR family response regulator transcription factor n=1 Tax=Paraflavitalea pollutisoli TaxID=3034143 RepID=UPI0023EA8791|nr:LytTR family DNA-binding domain-containing protein [Paraflavitalea sp. H1-2-19X]
MLELKPIRCLIVDDEPPAREVIRRYVQEVPTLHLVGECANAVQALTVLQQQPIDLLFLDIRMPQLDGTTFLKTLKNPPKVIFTTAYAEYALEGYELDIIDYLLKPVRFDRFLKAVNKACAPAASQPSFAAVTAAPAETLSQADEKRSDSFVYFRADRKMQKVMLHDILYIESMKDYVKINTTLGTIITKQSITSVESMLSEKQFVRTHRSFIVAIDKIRSYTNELIEIDAAEIPIGKLYRNGVLKILS